MDNKQTTNTEGNTPSRKYNIQNLKPFNKTDRVLSKEEAKKRGKNGGIKSGETRRARKTMRENLIELLSMELSPEKLEAMGADIGTLDGNYTLQNAVLASMVREAVNGSERAATLIRDTIGEAPINRTESVTEIITESDTRLMDDIKRSLIG